MPAREGQPGSSGRGAMLVAMGILASRLMGLVRQKLFSALLGSGVEAGAFVVATRIPNLLQNLLGEGVLSASFIPVYAGLRAQGRERDADRVASAVFGLLSLVVGVTVGVGLLASPVLVQVVAPGYQGPTFELTVRLVRLVFPGTGLLVLSAWCLGILNSHRRFFLSYAAPVVWNVCIIAALLLARGRLLEVVVVAAAWGLVAGSVLQFLVQVPAVLRLAPGLTWRPRWADANVRQVIRGFVPAVAARGVVQISAYLDTRFASLISERAVATLGYAQTIALLPVSLFGMAISAAELPELSAEATKGEVDRVKAIRERVDGGLERIAFFVVPSSVALVLLGDMVAGVLLESGRFTARDTRYCWYLLMAAGVALLAQTSGRLYSSALYALKDTRTPLRLAVVRVSLGAALGAWGALVLPQHLGVPKELGAAFLTLASGLTAWLEMVFLRRALERQVGRLPSRVARLTPLWLTALVAGGLLVALKALLASRFGARPGALEEWGGTVLPAPALPTLFQVDLAGLSGASRALAAGARAIADHAIPLGLLGAFGALYLGLAAVAGVPQARGLVRTLAARIKGISHRS